MNLEALSQSVLNMHNAQKVEWLIFTPNGNFVMKTPHIWLRDFFVEQHGASYMVERRNVSRE